MKTPHRTATLRDVAQVAGVSPSTASRVLNGGDKGVSEALAVRVLAVADSLGYVSNQAAQALRGRRTAVVLLASDPRTASIAAIAAGMEEAGRKQGVMVSITAAGSDARAHHAALSVLRDLRPRALVVTSASFASSARGAMLPELDEFQADGCSVVFIGEHETRFPAVRFDDASIGRVMAAHVAALGRERIAIAYTPGHPAMESRRQGFLEGLAEHGIDPNSVHSEQCEVSRDGGRAAAARLTALDPVPEVVMAGNDVVAFGVLAELRHRGIDVPGEIAVTGVDDIPLAQDVSPALTTVALPFVAAGRAALEVALATDEPADVHLTGRLVVRESTAGLAS